MCGIIGYIGTSEAKPILLEGLKRMEYRGYDSAGLAIIEQKKGLVQSFKKSGKLGNLFAELREHTVEGTVGIGHIRWATHGEPNDTNAHPHADCGDEIFIIHNGIIENFSQLKLRLMQEQHEFRTATDTEMLAHLIESYYTKKTTLEDAVTKALHEVIGTYGIAVLSSREPDKIVAARLGSPLILGIVAKGEYIVASDVTAIL
ncbi:MAG TPA: class II glutamine amidotransferase, partial [Patescibacteria group bacterium]|nr:class II glutamine amidotransferase [Patescibacteria group bacterium]